MFGRALSIFDFKFPYTLANILRKEENINRDEIDATIYRALKELAENHIIDSEGIAMFKLILKSAHRKSIINKGQQYTLDNIAETNKIFALEVFKLFWR